MIFLAGLWHSLKVTSAGLFWLLTIAFVWAGFALMGTSPQWGGADLLMAIGLFVARGLITRRLVTPGVSYVIGLGVQLAYLLVAAVLTGYSAGAHFLAVPEHLPT